MTTTTTLHSKRLSTYLNDHLALATAGAELVKRSASSNEGTPYGAVLARLEREIGEDRATLEQVMTAVDVSRNQVKVSLGWLGEKLGRLKLNDQLTGYSPLSRMVEFEGLLLLTGAARSLWASLGEVADDRLAQFDFAGLVARADAQRHALEEHRGFVAGAALTDAG